MKINEDRVRMELSKKMMTQRGLAVKMGWSPQRLNYMIKKGKSFRTAHMLGEALDVNPRVLMQ